MLSVPVDHLPPGGMCMEDNMGLAMLDISIFNMVFGRMFCKV